MFKKLLWTVAVTSTCFALPFYGVVQDKNPSICLKPLPDQPLCYKNRMGHKTEAQQQDNLLNQIMQIVNSNPDNPTANYLSLTAIKEMLQKESKTLNIDVINKVLSTLQCASRYNIDHNNILTIIDYSLPSSEKRLWIFDLVNKKLLFHTYVSHGIKSGTLFTNNFSNKNNSKASSIGVYKTEKAYYGRDGLSLRLDGLDRGFNDNASSRSVVMHGGWYVDENFIKKYGRAGRSWGCPAVPLELSKSIINTIKDKSIFVAYYPSDSWFLKSKFLKCERNIPAKQPIIVQAPTQPLPAENESREEVLFVESSKNNRQLDTRPVLAIRADYYEQIFHTKPPLSRMLRRQINNAEYIALSNNEFKNIVINHHRSDEHEKNDALEEINLVEPVIKMIRGYYETQMKILELGKIQDVTLKSDSLKSSEPVKSYTVRFEKNSMVNLKATNQFVRWLGL